MASTINTRDDVREDQTTAAPAPAWETVSFDPAAPRRPTVTGVDGREHELSDAEFKRWEASKEDTAMRKTAAEAQAGTGSLTRHLMTRPRVVQTPDENQIYGFQISQSLNESRVFALAPDENDDVRGYLKDASDFLHSTRTVLEKIDSAYRDLMLDKSLNPTARTQKLEAATSTAYQKAYVGHAKAMDALQAKIRFTEGELSKPLEAQAATPRSTELRAVLRDMKREDRNTLIRSAIHADAPSAAQRELLQCVLGSHHLTCGLLEIEQTLHVKTYNTRTQPELTRRLDLMRKSLDILGSIKPATLVSQYEGAMRSKFTQATAISGFASKAAASLAAINGG
jgi:hypothetical protein